MTLEKLIISSLDVEIREYESRIKDLPLPRFSKKHYGIIEELFDSVDNSAREYSYVSEKSLNFRQCVIAALIAILVLLSTVTVIAVVHPEYYMIIREKMREWTVTFMPEKDAVEETFVIKSGAVPEGYELINEVLEDGIYSACYSGGYDAEIVYVQESISETTVTGIDSENNYKEIEYLNGVRTIIMKKANCYTLFWVKDGYSFTVVGNCELQILKEYVSSIK